MMTNQMVIKEAVSQGELRRTVARMVSPSKIGETTSDARKKGHIARNRWSKKKLAESNVATSNIKKHS